MDIKITKQRRDVLSLLDMKISHSCAGTLGRATTMVANKVRKSVAFGKSFKKIKIIGSPSQSLGAPHDYLSPF